MDKNNKKNLNLFGNNGLEDTGSIIFGDSLKQSKKAMTDIKNGAIEKTGQKDAETLKTILQEVIPNPIWLSVSEAAKLGGIQTKTIRRAIQSKTLKYRITSNRYSIDLSSLVLYLHSNTKLKNKLNQYGLGQYIEGWRE